MLTPAEIEEAARILARLLSDAPDALAELDAAPDAIRSAIIEAWAKATADAPKPSDDVSTPEDE